MEKQTQIGRVGGEKRHMLRWCICGQSQHRSKPSKSGLMSVRAHTHTHTQTHTHTHTLFFFFCQMKSFISGFACTPSPFFHLGVLLVGQKYHCRSEEHT